MRALLFLLLLTTTLSAQRTLQGILTDAATGEPLAYAYVFLEQDQQYGVISNERGEYQINLDSTQMNDRLVFSLMSYQPHYLRLADLEPEQSFYNLRMNTSFLELQEIVILSDRGLRNIVQEVLDNIPNRYGSDHHLLKAYFRKYDIENQEYTQLVEAMLTIKDGAYTDPKKSVKSWIDEFRMSDYQGYGRKRFQTRKQQQPALLNGYATFMNSARSHNLHWVTTALKQGLEVLQFTNRGEYLEGQDTLIRIAYHWDIKANGGDAEQQARLKAYFSGEVLINRTKKVMLRNTVGNLDKGFYTDAAYQQVGSKYYLKQLVRGGTFRYDSLRHTHVYKQVLYVTDIMTGRETKT
ncbi:MAG: carboxypeptidase-like regulatory domain-containing protein, partial [Bacteroidota bacterium]